MRLGPHLSTYAEHWLPTGLCVSTLLYFLYTHNCSSAHNYNCIVKFADNTTVIGLISRGDEAAYREEVLKLAAWSSENNLYLNTRKTREIIMDFRKHSTDPAPLYMVSVWRGSAPSGFLGIFISANISWSDNTTPIIKKAQQRLHFLRVLRRHNLNSSLLLTFYQSSMESLLTYCITVWYSSCTVANRERLQSCKVSTEDHWLPSLFSVGHLHLALPQQSQVHHQRQFTPWL